MNIVIYFIAGFIVGFILKRYGVTIIWNSWKLFFTLYTAIYYRPKVNRYKKLLIKRGWTCKSQYSDFDCDYWIHPEKGEKIFYNAVCLETGKSPKI